MARRKNRLRRKVPPTEKAQAELAPKLTARQKRIAKEMKAMQARQSAVDLLRADQENPPIVVR